MKILLSAYACEPHCGSEPGVGWNMAQAIAQQHSVWVLTTATHKAGIEAELARHPNPNLQVIYLDPFGWVYDWSKGGKGLQIDVNTHYYTWQIKAYQVGRSLHQQIGFDLVHHVTYGRYYAPSFLSLLPIPFIWGPVGGGESAPFPFWQDFNRKGKIFESVRLIARTIGEWDPFVWLTARRSILGFACTPETAARMKALGVKDLRMLPGQTGIDQDTLDQLKAARVQKAVPIQAAEPIRFLSLGRLLHWKGFHLGLRAFAAANLSHAEYWIAGTGAEQDRLAQLAIDLGIQEKVRFLGNLKRDQALQAMGQCDVLVHPSLHDFSPTVCLEAMAARLPVLCLDLGGPSIQITPETGIKASGENPTLAVQEMAKAMIQLSADPELRDRLGKAGQERVQQFYRWENRVEPLMALYQEAIAESQPQGKTGNVMKVP